MLSHEPKGKMKRNSRVAGGVKGYRIRRKPSAMHRQAFRVRVCQVILGVAIGLFSLSAPAHADLLDTVLGILAPDYVEAKGVIACIVNQGTFNEAMAKACIAQQAKAQSKKLVPSDPKLKSIVDTVFAAKNGDWVRVVELLGTDGLKTVVCSGVVSVGGPVKDLVCGTAYQVAKPVIKPALHAVLKPDWWELLTLLGPGAACGVIPGGEAKDALCGVLGQALAEAGKLIKGGVNAAKDVAIDFGETISGQTQHIPPEQYYKTYWLPKVYSDALWVLRAGGPGSYKIEYDHCVDYFDSHKASRSTAEKWCGKMKSQFISTRDTLVKIAKAAPAAYYSAKIKPQIPGFALDYYHGITSGGFTGPQLGGACTKEIGAMIPGVGIAIENPYQKGPTWSNPPYTIGQWACHQVFTKLNQEIYAYKQQVLQPLLGKLGAAGCRVMKAEGWYGAKDMLYVQCDNYEGAQMCRHSLLGQPVKVPKANPSARHCGVYSPMAGKKLAEKIVKALGPKRCEVALQSGYTHIINCTRPWKYEQCKTLLTEATQGFPGVQVECQSKDKIKNEPAFSVQTQQSQNILNTLNGVKKVGSVQQPGGKTQGLVMVPPVKVCMHGVDPFAISCPGNPKAPAEMGIKLPPCPADPNKDGADTPCYAGPFSIASGANQPMVGTPQPGIAPIPPPAVPQVPGGQKRTPLPPRP